MLYCAYTCDYVIFSSFSQASRNFLANFREGARKSLNRAENRGGLGIIRDDSGSIRKVLKTVRPKATGVRIPLPAPKMKHQSLRLVLLFLLRYERILTPLCDSPSRRMGFAYPTRRSKSSLFRRRVWVSSPLVNTPLSSLRQEERNSNRVTFLLFLLCR